jgi:outer membrane PBP1 activator LpoA protein
VSRITKILLFPTETILKNTNPPLQQKCRGNCQNQDFQDLRIFRMGFCLNIPQKPLDIVLV